MSQNQQENITVVLSDSDFGNLIHLLDERIRSERARASAFKARHDHSNQMIASGRKAQLLDLRNALVIGCQEGVDDV